MQSSAPINHVEIPDLHAIGCGHLHAIGCTKPNGNKTKWKVGGGDAKLEL
jgi:hypothetical protein